MPNQALGFAEICIGGILIVMGFTGDSLANVVKGNISPQPLTTTGGGGSSGLGVAATTTNTKNASFSGSTTSSTQLTATQRANASTLMSYFQSQGLSKAGAAGLVGNFVQESGINPAEQNGYLAQWLGGRLANLESFASSTGQSVTSLQTQAQFVIHELQSYPGLLSLLKSTTSPSVAALAVSNQYERPSLLYANNSGRQAYATEIYNTTS